MDKSDSNIQCNLTYEFKLFTVFLYCNPESSFSSRIKKRLARHAPALWRREHAPTQRKKRHMYRRRHALTQGEVRGALTLQKGGSGHATEENDRKGTLKHNYARTQHPRRPRFGSDSRSGKAVKPTSDRSRATRGGVRPPPPIFL